MASKLALLIQGLLVMVVLISFMGEARHLAEVATKQNSVDSVKYCAKLSGKADSDASSDCFLIPGIPSLIPGWPGTTTQPLIPTTPVTPTTPLISTPVTPTTSLIPTPVTPTTPLTPKLLVAPATPLIPSPHIVEVATKKNEVDNVKYCAKLSGKVDSDASSDCFLIPGIPSLIPGWPGTTTQPLIPTTPLISTPVTPTTPLISTPVTPTTSLIPTPVTPTTPLTPKLLVDPATPLIPSPHIVEVATKKNEVDNVKYCAKLSGKADSDASSDCFLIPGIPSIIPGWPGTTTQPLIPTTPLIPTPVTPTTPLISTPLTPTTPLIPTPVTPTTPLTPSPPVAPVTPVTPSPPATPVTPSSPATPVTPSPPVTPATPSSPVTPSPPVTPATPSPPATPVTPSPPVTPATPGSPKSSPLR